MTLKLSLVVISLLLVGSYLIYRVFRTDKVDPNDFKNQWRSILLREVVYYQNLIPRERERFEIDILKFFSKVRITGVDTKISTLDRLLVASSAVIPLFGYPGSTFENLSEVIIYKGNFNHNYETEGKKRNILGMVGDGHMNGHMILSKPALRKGYNHQDASHNVGIHEFVHLLDKADGNTDGIPKFVLKSKEVKPWLKVVHGEIEAILNGDSKINPYGATNEAEFFSVASEYFFMNPKLLSSDHPELYLKLKRIYHQDPEEGIGIIL